MNLTDLKAQTEENLRRHGVEINPNLPTIEAPDEVKPKSARDVAGRACAIAYVIGVAFDAPTDQLKSWISEYSLWEWVSPHEAALLDSNSISTEDKNKYSWLAESAQALVWALGMVDLDARSMCDDDLATKIPFKSDPTSFIASAKL